MSLCQTLITMLAIILVMSMLQLSYCSHTQTKFVSDDYHGPSAGKNFFKLPSMSVYRLCLVQGTVCFYDPEHCQNLNVETCEKITILTNYLHGLQILDPAQYTQQGNSMGVFIMSKLFKSDKESQSVSSAIRPNHANSKHKYPKMNYDMLVCTFTINHDNSTMMIQSASQLDNNRNHVGVDNTPVEHGLQRPDKGEYYACSWSIAQDDIGNHFSREIRVLSAEYRMEITSTGNTLQYRLYLLIINNRL